MTDLFIQVLNMSITASYIIVAVVVIRWLLQRLRVPAVFSYILWLPVWIRLALPFSFHSPISLFTLFKPDAQTGLGAMEYIPDRIGNMQHPAVDLGSVGLSRWVSAALPEGTPYASLNPLQVYLALAGVIWLAGIVALLVYSVVSYRTILRRLRLATRVEDRMYETDQITTPFVCGFLRPRIYIPVGLGEQEQAFILAHEEVHLNRRDYWIKPLAFAILVLHWFNPLAWVAFLLMSKDMEKACDERVIDRLGVQNRSGYAHTLLSLSARRSGLPTGSPLCFGEGHIKGRIRNVLHYRRPRLAVSLIAIAVTAALILGLTANPVVEAAGGGLTLPSAAPAPAPADGPADGYTEAEPVASPMSAEEFEAALDTIMSSPLTSSNPGDYLRAHPAEHQAILAQGDAALDYFMGQIRANDRNGGLRGHILMLLSKELLGDRNTVHDDSLQPMQWYVELTGK